MIFNLKKKLAVLKKGLPIPFFQLINVPTNNAHPIDQQTVPGLLNYILDMLSAIAYPLAFVALIYTAYLLLVSAGNPEGYQKAKKNFMYVLTGIFFIVFSVSLLRFVTGLLNVPR